MITAILCAHSPYKAVLIVWRFALAVFTTTLWMATPVFSQTIINVPPEPAPSSVESNTTLNLLDGGLIDVEDRFEIGAYDGSSVNAVFNMLGGRIETRDNVRANANSQVNIFGGEVVGGMSVLAGSVVNISGGVFSGNFFDSGEVIANGGQLSISGGEFGGLGGIVASGIGSVVDISGGSFFSIEASRGTETTIRGGAFNSLTARDKRLPLSSVVIKGDDFRVDGHPLAGLDEFGDRLQYDIPDLALLTGTLEDGTPFMRGGVNIAPGVLTLQRAELPPIGPELIRASTDVIPHGIREGQTLLVDDGGVLDGVFIAGSGSTLIVEPGGFTDGPIKAYEAKINITGGTHGSNYGMGFINALNSEINITDGVFRSFSAMRGSSVNITGGDFGFNTYVGSGSQASISGGAFDGFNLVGEESIAHITGGTFNTNSFTIGSSALAYISGGDFPGITVKDGGSANFFGSAFYIDGVEVEGLIPGEEFLVTGRDVTLSGTLADGLPFSIPLNRFPPPRGQNYISDEATITLAISIPEPSTIFLFMLAAVGRLMWRR